jgi:hypothetical protein
MDLTLGTLRVANYVERVFIFENQTFMWILTEIGMLITYFDIKLYSFPHYAKRNITRIKYGTILQQ